MLEIGAGEQGDAVARAVTAALRIGPLASRLKAADPDVRARNAARLATAFAARVQDGAVRLGGAGWVITARATG